MAAVQQNQWLRNYPEENHVEKEEEELLVFGYSCKLFRDDEKALYVDQGRHLIPWMGDDGLMIDRYDARGYLHDLKKYEAKSSDVVEPMSEDERRIEELCEEERYLALYKDMTEEEMYHEEELKRLRAALASEGGYHEIGFNYENFKEERSSYCNETLPKDDSDDEPYEVPEGLTIPPGMILPSTMKIHTIIEKTATFISQQGLQMEIVIKTKQASNPQFNFLSFDSPLNAYYKHLIMSIKSGKYHPKPPKKHNDSEDSDDNSDDDDDHYLHPSLLGGKSKSEPDGPLLLPFIPFRRQDDAYSRLVQSLKDKIVDSRSANSSPAPYGSSNRANADDDQDALDFGHHSSYYSYNDLAAYYATYGSSVPPPPGVEPVMLPYLEQPPPPGEEERTSFSVRSSNGSDSPFTLDGGAAANNEDLYGNAGPNAQNITPPPPDLQPIIDKMAEYVAKNGDDFEIIVKSKNDKRFEFLDEGNEYHPYYTFRKKMHTQQKNKDDAKALGDQKAKDDEEKKAQKNLLYSKAPKAPVSFSIKPKDVELSGLEKKKRKKAALLDESESEKEEDGSKKEDLFLEAGDNAVRKKKETNSNSETEESSTVAQNEKVKKPTPQEMEAKLAEERIKDKLVAAARERLAHQSREKQLQLERKKKAALFLNMLKKSAGPTDNKGSDAFETKTRQSGFNSTNSTAQLSPGIASSPSNCTKKDTPDISPLPSQPGSPQLDSKLPKSDSDRISNATELNPGLKALLNLHTSYRKQADKSPKHYSSSLRHKSYRHRSRSRSPSRSHYPGRHYDYFPHQHRRHHSSSHRRSRSRSRSRSGSYVPHPRYRSRSRSPSKHRSSGFESKRHKTPPSAYAVVRRSRSRSPSPRRHGRR